MLSFRTKTFLKLIALLAVVAVIGIVIVLAFFRGGPAITIPTEPIPEEPAGELPTSGTFVPTPVVEQPTEGAVLPVSGVAAGGPVLTVQLTASAVNTPTLVSGSQIVYYDKRDGKFYTIDKNGNILAYSDAVFAKAETIVMSENAKKAAIEFPDGSNIIYDFATETQTTLPSHWEDFTFSADSTQLISKSIGTDVNNRALVLSSADGSRAQAIAALGDNADKVTVQFSPNNNFVAFSETGSVQTAFGRDEIYLIDSTGKAADNLIVDGANFSALWAPNGADLLYSVAEVANDDFPTLWYAKISDAQEARKNLNVATWVEKCTFTDATTIICAVPREMVSGGGFDHRLVTAADDVYQINVITGKKQLLASPVSNLQMSNLNLSDDGTILYFTDNYGRLNTLQMK